MKPLCTLTFANFTWEFNIKMLKRLEEIFTVPWHSKKAPGNAAEKPHQQHQVKECFKEKKKMKFKLMEVSQMSAILQVTQAIHDVISFIS